MDAFFKPVNTVCRIGLIVCLSVFALMADAGNGTTNRRPQATRQALENVWIEPSVQTATILLRKEFAPASPARLKRATLSITSQGMNEAWLNGEKVGDDFFSPGWTEYNHRLLYRQYDVTDLLNKRLAQASGQDGRRCTHTLGIMLANGWYRSRMARMRGRWVYGDKLRAAARLSMVYQDGTEQTVTTDDTWQCHAGEITASDIYDGEVCDARLTQQGWTLAGFSGRWKEVRPADAPKAELMAAECEPVRIIRQLKPKRIFTSPKGERIVDFGQNITGWVKLQLKGVKGDTVRLRFAEALDKDGNFYTLNLRKAKATDVYVFGSNGKETHHPRFTFFGFRYMKIEGYPHPVKKADFTAQVLSSDLARTGTFECSDPMVNKLVENTRWSMTDNFVDIPTDCPQRDERLGWTADAQVFAPAACYLADARRFFAKWLEDVRLSQAADGGVPCVVPDLRQSYGSSGWDDVVTVLPSVLYKVYGDTATLRRMYPCMVKWVDYCIRKAGASGVYPGGRFGDWFDFATASGKEPATPKDLVGTAYMAYSARLTAEAAQVLGLHADELKYDSLFLKVRQTFQKQYIQGTDRLTSDTQTAYVLALAFHLADAGQQEAFAGRLAELVREEGHITTGFLGTPLICKVLTDYGYEDEAYSLLTRRTYPSWLYPIDKGATTVWERWDAIKPDGSLSGHSLNHYAFGAVVAWLFSDVAGISQTDGSAGFSHLLIRPRLTEKLHWVKASYRSTKGWVRVAWRAKKNAFKMSVTVPQGSTATVMLPYPDKNGESLRQVAGGTHTFSIRKAK